MPSGNVEFTPPGSPRADEDCVEILFQQRLHAGYLGIEVGFDTHFEHEVDFVVQHVHRQPERRDLAAHHAAAFLEDVVHDHVIAERQQVPGHAEGGRSGTDTSNALAVLLLRNRRPVLTNIFGVVGGNALQPADRHRLIVDSITPACRFARPVAGAPEDPGEYVRFPVDQVRVGVLLIGDEPNVFGDWSVGRASPLAIHHPVVVIRVRRVGWFHGS